MADLTLEDRYAEAYRLHSEFRETKDESHLHTAFRLLDLDGNGVISKEEFFHFATATAGEVAGRAFTDAFFRMGDTNQDGSLQEDEFVAVVAKVTLESVEPFRPSPEEEEYLRLMLDYKRTKNPQHLEAVFRLIDKNNDGLVSTTELLDSPLTSILPSKTLAAHLVMAVADVNQDGVLSLEEFVSRLPAVFQSLR